MANPTSNSMTPQMRAFCDDHKEYSKLAQQRDKEARLHLGEDKYDIYRQGSYRVIKARAHAEYIPSLEGRVFSSKNQALKPCFKCQDVMSTSDDHVHKCNPSKRILCPECYVILSRDDKVTIDEHLAKKHQVFLNLKGRAWDLVSATQGNVFEQHTGVELARFMLKKQIVNLRVAVYAADDDDDEEVEDKKEKSAALRRIYEKYNNRLPRPRVFRHLSKEATMELLRDVRLALSELDGEFRWGGMQGKVEGPGNWSGDQNEDVAGHESDSPLTDAYELLDWSSMSE